MREIPHLEAALWHRAAGFPIDVRYNGEPLPRPRAVDGGLRFERTEVGEVYLYGAMPGEDWTYASDEIACYFQGLPVYTCGYGGCLGVDADLRKLNVSSLRNLIDTVDRDPYFRSQVKIMRAKVREIEEENLGVKLVDLILR